MFRFIIGGNRRNGEQIVEAATQFEARKLAIIKDFRAGYMDEELRVCWAEPWTWDLAYEYDLLPYEEHPQWVGVSPWMA
jgi:hypothetical protein